ncbi:hypothetical protein ANCCAN_03753 [Ancylostoma caninum]|uniref:C-type lectin domain-containing protein n=1 Tax=Ancylostoma caninum TaxID=29170 RepID=A0A368H305_ANCCA|nr:hypothetical protein ANCCAN_03753 [Ancylostoma caninum]
MMAHKFAGRICNAGTEGFLSKVENHEKALFLMNLLPQNYGNGPAWIGLKRDGKDKKWTWPDGTVKYFISPTQSKRIIGKTLKLCRIEIKCISG